MRQRKKRLVLSALERREIVRAMQGAMTHAVECRAIARDALDLLERVEAENERLRGLLSLDAERGAAVN